VPCRTPLILDT
jgi:hypothetical protein